METIKTGLSVIVPVYNSQESLPLLVEEVSQILINHHEQFEIILVNDGSRDNSWKIIEDLSSIHPEVRGVNLIRNFGQHNALLCEIRLATYSIIVTMDDDLQHPPSEIYKLVDEIRSGKDLVYASPKKETHSWWRNFSSNLSKWALKVSTHITYAEKISAFRAFQTNLRDNFENFLNPYVSIDVLLSWGATKIGFIEVDHHVRKSGVSQYTFRKLLKHAINMLLGFSVLPLRIASILGFIFTLFGFIVLSYVLIRYFIQGGGVPGFSFLASTIAIFSGIILFVLGIIGEYLARLYINMMSKPQYMISQTTEPK
ncbi:MAG: glycosyltransferase [Chloroflexi bacterium]|nr:glycosyltransferase [Chloroflexota bacterium]